MRIEAAFISILVIFVRVSSEKPPHLFLILADDVGFNSVGFHGNNPETITPHIDELAASGAIFMNFHSYFWCSPSRASLMSGRYPHHIFQEEASVMSADQGLPLGMTTLASKLKTAGYSTVHAGSPWYWYHANFIVANFLTDQHQCF
jgi:arylsulfatase B